MSMLININIVRRHCSMWYKEEEFQDYNINYFHFINNLREKFSPGPGIEPGSPALRAGANNH